MYRVLAGTGSVFALAVTLSGCSSAPEVAGTDSDALIAACLNGAEELAQEEENATVEGSVSSVTTEENDDGKTEVFIVLDARDENGTADPAQCELTVAGGTVEEFVLGSPDDGDMPPAVDGAQERWNDDHAEDWADGGGPEAIAAPDPEPETTTYFDDN